MYASLNSDPSDPDVIIKLDISNAFNVLCRRLTLDVLGGKASCDYACGLKEGDNIETICTELRNMFSYFKALRTTQSHLRYFDFCGSVLDAWGKTGGQQGDPLEMIAFCLSIHHLWGRTLAKHYQDACVVAYADDGYIKAKLSVAIEVLSDIKHVLREDAGLDLNDKTRIFVKGISAAEAHTATQRLLTADPSLAHLGPLVAPTAFVDDGYIGLGVPIGTDAFVQHFVKKKCQDIMDDVDKLDNIQDDFIASTTNWCASTKLPRLQYLNAQIDLANQNVLQQHDVDWKISNALLKKGTRDAYKTWNQQDRAWDEMRLHESHDEGGFSVSNNTITRHAASFTTNNYQRQVCCLPGHLCTPRSAGLAARQRPPGPLKLGCPPSARSSACTGTSCASTTAQSSRQWHSPRCRPPAAALLPTRSHTRSLTLAPRTTATASSSYRNSTAFIWHSC
jgi:hypothetical protein